MSITQGGGSVRLLKFIANYNVPTRCNAAPVWLVTLCQNRLRLVIQLKEYIDFKAPLFV